jgi:hypothetical protein
MTKYPCSSINLEHAFFKNVADCFIGQKVLLSSLDKEIIGQVESCSLEDIKVKLFGNVDGFILSKTTGNFIDSFVEIPLSPSLLGRQLDFFGNPIDGLPFVIPVSKVKNFYLDKTPYHGIKSEIVGEKDWLIKTESFSIQKGEVKSYKDFPSILPILNISNLALLIVELDYRSNKFKNLQQDLVENSLYDISIFIKSKSFNDVAAAPFCLSQVANYLSNQLNFDVLIVVSNSELLQDKDINKFYFIQNIEQLARFEASHSITIIKI